jgi:hypothetical protein
LEIGHLKEIHLTHFIDNNFESNAGYLMEIVLNQRVVLVCKIKPCLEVFQGDESGLLHLYWTLNTESCLFMAGEKNILGHIAMCIAERDDFRYQQLVARVPD